MITQAILDCLLKPIVWLLDFIPAFTFMNDFAGIAYYIDLMAKVACVVPVNSFMYALLVWVFFASTDIFYQAAMWVIRKIPGIS